MAVAGPVPDFPFDAATTISPLNRMANNSCFDFHHQRHISAPNSPNSAASIYAVLRESAANTRGSRHSYVPFDWEERPGTPKSYCDDEKEDDFEFDFAFGLSSRHIDKAAPPPEPAVTSADELFELGMIRPLKLPPRLYTPVLGSPKSPRSGRILSPLRRGRNQQGKGLDPFALAMVEATKSRKGSRSLSPFRGRDGKGGEFYTPKSSPPRLPRTTAEKGGRGWKLRFKEIFHFRNSKERQPMEEAKKNDLRMYENSTSSSSSLSTSSSSSSSRAPIKEKTGLGDSCGGEESRCSSFRSTESGSTRQGTVTPHEMEYKESKTDAPELEMKNTVIPYTQSKFSLRGLTTGKFGGTFNRRRA